MRQAHPLLRRQDVSTQGLPHKELFCVRYGDIQYANQCVAAWYVHLTDGLEDTIVAWLKDMGWEAVVDDTREDEDEDECE